jgi:hypothetical protein
LRLEVGVLVGSSRTLLDLQISSVTLRHWLCSFPSPEEGRKEKLALDLGYQGARLENRWTWWTLCPGDLRSIVSRQWEGLPGNKGTHCKDFHNCWVWCIHL